MKGEESASGGEAASRGAAAPFVVTTPSSTVALDASRRGAFPLSITNVSGRARRVQVRVLPTAPADAAWFFVDGAEQQYNLGETRVHTVGVNVPASAAAGTYQVRSDAVAEDEPAEVFVEGPTVAVDVPAAPRRRFPWWILVAIGVAVLVLGGLLAFLLTQDGDSDLTAPTIRSPEEGAVVECDATPCPVALRWDAVDGASDYEVRVGASGADAQFVRVVSDTAVSAPLTPSGPLELSVAARREGTSGPAATRTFSVVPRLTAPSITEPLANQRLVCSGPCPVAVSWSAVTGARSYDVVAHTGSATGAAAATAQATATTAQLTVPASGSFVITVEALDDDRRGPAGQQPVSVVFVRHSVATEAVVNATITIDLPIIADITVNTTSGPLRQAAELTQPGQRVTVLDTTADLTPQLPSPVPPVPVRARIVVDATLSQLEGPIVLDASVDVNGQAGQPVQFSVGPGTSGSGSSQIQFSAGAVAVRAVTAITVTNALV